MLPLGQTANWRSRSLCSENRDRTYPTSFPSNTGVPIGLPGRTFSPRPRQLTNIDRVDHVRNQLVALNHQEGRLQKMRPPAAKPAHRAVDVDWAASVLSTTGDGPRISLGIQVELSISVDGGLRLQLHCRRRAAQVDK